MNQRTRLLRCLGCALALLFLMSRVDGAELRKLPGQVPSILSQLLPLGRLNATNRIDLAIGLPLRNRDILTNLLQQLYDPASTNFHHYLTPGQFTDKFGPTETDYQTVLRFVSTNGLKVVGSYSHRELVDVSGTAADIEKAFHVRLLTYRHPREPREFYAPDTDPSVATNVPIQSIGGLNSFDRPFPGARRQSGTRNLIPANGTGPGGTTYRGKDFRNAYAPGVALTGSGQSVGLVEFDGYYQSDITTYETQAGLPNVPLTIIPLSGSSGFPDNNINFVSEVSLDIEMVIAMAPGLNTLYVFEGNSFDSMLGSMVTNSQIKVFSSSWFGGGFTATGDGFLQQMAAQGQTFFQASGDGDAYTQPITGPGDDPYVTAVGGTSLTMDYYATNYVSESVWNSGFQSPGWNDNGAYTNGATVGGYWGSGGGISSTYPIPGWQQGVNMTAVGGSATKRNVPDVALTAVNIWVNYFNGLSGSFEGTSCAAPLWAGFAALVNEQAAADGRPPIGFINPALYAIGASQSYTSSFRDITSGNDNWPGSTSAFSAGTGYDLCTGWGTPNGTNTIKALEGFSGPVYVDFNYNGVSQNGSYYTPFKTFTAGLNAVGIGGTVVIKTAGSSLETLTVAKPATITAVGGAATIGH